MDTEVMTQKWSRDELEHAHQHYMETAGRCAASGEWRDWADLFTEDAVYLEHTFGTFRGPDEIYEWITPLMAEWPNKDMTSFPHAWCVCDEERGWWICRIENRMKDPGDGSVHQAHNITVLHYAGDMKFSYEEDAYNPAAFGPMIQAWTEAYTANGGTPECWSARGVVRSSPGAPANAVPRDERCRGARVPHGAPGAYRQVGHGAGGRTAAPRAGLV